MNDFTIDIERKLNRLGKDLRQAVERVVPVEDRGRGFRPDCDILESDEAYKIIIDLPGLSKNEINISLKDYVLTVKGERVGDLDDTEVYRRHERAEGMFSRSFALPKNVVTEELKAHHRNGTLTISMNKAGEGEDSTNIPIS